MKTFFSICKYGWLLLALLLLAACSDDPIPTDPGDPVPNARAGMIAMYSGDLAGVNRYFCDEIKASINEIATTAAAGQGNIEFGNAKLLAAPEKISVNWTYVRLSGRYSIWLNGLQEVHDTEVSGEPYILMKIEDDAWKICDFQSSATPEPQG